MKNYTYTKRELSIIRRKDPLDISNEEFLSICRKAFCRNSISTLKHMHNVYPGIASEVTSEKFIKNTHDPADEEANYQFPILILTTRFTQARIMNIVAYLLGKTVAPKTYITQLSELIPYRLVFNYFTDEYVKDFLTEPLWNDFFLKQEELRRAINMYLISCLQELVIRASEYFEKLVPESMLRVDYDDKPEYSLIFRQEFKNKK